MRERPLPARAHEGPHPEGMRFTGM
jgi:hypothetical protein